MINAKQYAEFFRAAAEGYMSPYRINGAMFSSSDYQAARSTSGAMIAIATIFENMAKSSSALPDETKPISLLRCAMALQGNEKIKLGADLQRIAKAVLDAAGVKYVD